MVDISTPGFKCCPNLHPQNQPEFLAVKKDYDSKRLNVELKIGRSNSTDGPFPEPYEGENVVEMIYFTVNSYRLLPKEKSKLDKISRDFSYRIVGFTDSTGSVTFNRSLAKLRAVAVARYLRSIGVVVEKWEGKGKCCFIYFYDESLNRRVELVKVRRVEKKPLPPPKEKKPFAKFIWLSDISAYVTYSTLIGGTSIFGGNATVVLAPTIQFLENRFLIILYDGSYHKKKQIFVEDEGPRISSESQIHTLSPTFKLDYSPRLTVSGLYFHTLFLSRETSEEKWYQGLYDYNDSGFSLDMKYLLSATKTSAKRLSIGIQQYERVYPNFRSLFSLAGLGTLEEREKDFSGTGVSTSYSSRNSLGLSHSISFSYLLKSYREKLIETDIGGRTDQKQEDNNYSLSLLLNYKPNPEFNYILNTTVIYNQSNQNLAEGSFPEIIFHENYYSYYTFTLGPRIVYRRRLAGTQSLTFDTGYSVSRMAFPDRVARDEEGYLTETTEVDWTHNLSASLTYSLDDHWRFGTIVDYTAVRSNMKYETLTRYSYEILNISFGFSHRY